MIDNSNRIFCRFCRLEIEDFFQLSPEIKALQIHSSHLNVIIEAFISQINILGDRQFPLSEEFIDQITNDLRLTRNLFPQSIPIEFLRNQVPKGNAFLRSFRYKFQKLKSPFRISLMGEPKSGKSLFINLVSNEWFNIYFYDPTEISEIKRFFDGYPINLIEIGSKYFFRENVKSYLKNSNLIFLFMKTSSSIEDKKFVLKTLENSLETFFLARIVIFITFQDKEIMSIPDFLNGINIDNYPIIKSRIIYVFPVSLILNIGLSLFNQFFARIFELILKKDFEELERVKYINFF